MTKEEKQILEGFQIPEELWDSFTQLSYDFTSTEYSPPEENLKHLCAVLSEHLQYVQEKAIDKSFKKRNGGKFKLPPKSKWRKRDEMDENQ